MWLLELGFWFWLFFGGFIVLGIWAHESDAPEGGIIGFILFILGLQFLFSVPVWQSIVANPLWVVLLLVGYAAIGFVYGIFWKWRRYCRDNAESAVKRFNMISNNGDKFEDNIDDTYYNELHPANNKKRIIGWIVQWPFGLLWTLINDPIKWLAEEIYRISAETLKSISDKALKRVIK